MIKTLLIISLFSFFGCVCEQKEDQLQKMHTLALLNPDGICYDLVNPPDITGRYCLKKVNDLKSK